MATKGRMARLAAAAELPKMTLARFCAWLAAAAIVQLTWGLYGVCTRYLQTSVQRPIPTLQLMVAINLIAWPGLIIFCTIPTAVARWWAARGARRAAAAEAAAAEAPPAPAEPAAPPAPLGVRFRAYARTTALATGIGGIISMQALTQVYASRFANAYLAQMVFMFTPLCTALANRALLKQPTPPKLWPALLLSLGGAVMVITGQWLSDKAAGKAKATNIMTTRDMVVGLALAATSTLLLSAYLVIIQVTRHLVSGEAVLWGKRNVAMLVFVPLSLIVEGLDWGWVPAMSGKDWAVLIFTGLIIYTLANIWLQFCSRALGAALVSVFMSLRLVSSIVGSVVLLREVPTSALSWAGFALVIVVMTAFLLLQWHAKKRDAAAAAAAAAGLPPGAAAEAEEESEADELDSPFDVEAALAGSAIFGGVRRSSLSRRRTSSGPVVVLVSSPSGDVAKPAAAAPAAPAAA
ncbi:hypothetical protein HT031_005956 [Scenedesmus sp. PABB004]|nr:hypothetical protein HT031_005956 [Scenedesmus sp. PABB004]